MHWCGYEAKLSNLKLKTWPKQLLGSLPLDIAHPKTRLEVADIDKVKTLHYKLPQYKDLLYRTPTISSRRRNCCTKQIWLKPALTSCNPNIRDKRRMSTQFVLPVRHTLPKRRSHGRTCTMRCHHQILPPDGRMSCSCFLLLLFGH